MFCLALRLDQTIGVVEIFMVDRMRLYFIPLDIYDLTSTEDFNTYTGYKILPEYGFIIIYKNVT